MRIHQDRNLRLSQHVNEARRHDHAMRVDGTLARRGTYETNGRNAPIANADIAEIPGRACAVNDIAVADDEIVGCVRGVSAERRQGEEKKHDKGGTAKEFWHEERL